MSEKKMHNVTPKLSDPYELYYIFYLMRLQSFSLIEITNQKRVTNIARQTR